MSWLQRTAYIRRASRVPAHSVRPPDASVRLAVALFMIGAYIQLTIRASDGAVLFPYVLSVASGGYLALKLAVLRSGRTVDLILALTALLVGQTALIALSGGAVVEQIRGGLQLVVSLVASIGLYVGLKASGQQFVSRLGATIAAILLVGAAAETFTPVRGVGDAIRSILYDPRYLYTADIRDVSLYGAVRPNFLASEPSYLALFFVLGLFIWYVTTSMPRRRVEIIGSLAALLALIVIRSPVVLLIVPLAVAAWLLLFRLGRTLWPPGMVATAGISLYILGTGALQRLYAAGSIDASSVNIRIIAPIYTAASALSRSPVWGYGVGVEKGIEELVLVGYDRAGLDLTSALWYSGGSFQSAADVLTNNFFWHWIYFGLVGGILIGVVMYRIWTSLGMRYPLFVGAVVFIVWQAFGGYVDIRSVMVVAIAAAISDIVGESRPKEDIPTSHG